VRARKVSLCCLAGALIAPGAAYAQIDPGVNYDPGSPAGKEYAIPLVEGRSEGAGTTNWQQGANIPFGAGVEPARRAANVGGRGERKPTRRELRARREREQQVTARIRDAEAPGGTAGRTLMLALAVLLPAGLVSLLLAQRPQASRNGRAA